MNYFLLSIILLGMNSAHASQMSSVAVHKKIVDATLNDQMYMVIRYGKPQDLRTLFAKEKIPNINDQKYYGSRRTPLISAVRHNNFANAQTLIDLGADVNIRDGNGESALDIACREHELSHESAVKLIQLLVLNGANEECANKRRYSQRAASLEKAITQRKEYNSKIAKEIVSVQEDLVLDVARIVADYSFEKLPTETEEKSK